MQTLVINPSPPFLFITQNHSHAALTLTHTRWVRETEKGQLDGLLWPDCWLDCRRRSWHSFYCTFHYLLFCFSLCFVVLFTLAKWMPLERLRWSPIGTTAAGCTPILSFTNSFSPLDPATKSLVISFILYDDEITENCYLFQCYCSFLSAKLDPLCLLNTHTNCDSHLEVQRGEPALDYPSLSLASAITSTEEREKEHMQSMIILHIFVIRIHCNIFFIIKYILSLPPSPSSVCAYNLFLPLHNTFVYFFSLSLLHPFSFFFNFPISLPLPLLSIHTTVFHGPLTERRERNTMRQDNQS